MRSRSVDVRGRQATKEMTMRSQVSTGLIATLLASFALQVQAAGIQQSVLIPAPAFDEPTGAPGLATSVIAGGCFWGVQAVFQHTEGVLKAVSGYAGGSSQTAHYEIVGRGDTGHAESV